MGEQIGRYFFSSGHEVAGVGRFRRSFPWRTWEMSLPDAEFMTVLRDFAPQVLIHCAGTSSVLASVDNPLADFKNNVDVCAFTLDAVRQQAPSCKFVLLSSASVYGNPVDLPIAETVPCSPISPYGYHKYLCETLVDEYSIVYGLNTATLRIFSAYGEGLRRQVLYDLCCKFSDPATRTVEVYGTGNETRDFIHAVDVARAIDVIIAAGCQGVVNVASGSQRSIGQVAGLIRSCLGNDKDMRFTGRVRAGEPLYWEADISQLKNMGFQPCYTLETGIANYCRWFQALQRGE